MKMEENMADHMNVCGMFRSTSFSELGFEDWKWRKSGTEGYGRCPVCQPKRNTTAFSFDDGGKFHCFSCSAKGRDSVDLVMAVKKCGFKDAVAFLESIAATKAA